MPMVDLKKTGENINRLRVKNNMSVKELQDVFGFTTPQAIYKWQHGQPCRQLIIWWCWQRYSE